MTIKTSVTKSIKENVKKLLKHLDIKAKISIKKDPDKKNALLFVLDTEQSSFLIGQHGQNLIAFQDNGVLVMLLLYHQRVRCNDFHR